MFIPEFRALSNFSGRSPNLYAPATKAQSASAHQAVKPMDYSCLSGKVISLLTIH
jgi:hypothetical protein